MILTVGTDCAIGKMSVALELRRAAQAAGRSAAFVATGQTGIMIEGWGVAVDRVIADFLQGTVEWLVEEGESRGDWVIVEGQGSLDHPAYSSVTLGLIHGATPHAMVMVHKPGMADHDFDHLPDARFPIAPLGPYIAAHETVAALVAPSQGRRDRAQHLAHRRRRRGAARDRGDGGRDRAAVRRTPCVSAARACGRTSRRAWTPCPGSRLEAPADAPEAEHAPA